VQWPPVVRVKSAPGQRNENGTIWGRLRWERYEIRGLVEAGVPAEVVGELIVEDAGAICSSRCAPRGHAEETARHHEFGKPVPATLTTTPSHSAHQGSSGNWTL